MTSQRPRAGAVGYSAPVENIPREVPASEPIFARLSDGTLAQAVDLPGDDGRRLKIRVGFSGTVAGQAVKRGDVLTIGRTLALAMKGARFDIL
jgi:hypothetical protein